jgi:hypothetical protein
MYNGERERYEMSIDIPRQNLKLPVGGSKMLCRAQSEVSERVDRFNLRKCPQVCNHGLLKKMVPFA